MIVKRKFPFIICRDGHLLYTNEVRSILSGVTITYGFEHTLTTDGFIFPISSVTDLAVEQISLFCKYFNHKKAAAYYRELSGEPRRSAKRKAEALAASKASEKLSEKYYNSLKRYEEINENKFFTVSITPQGELVEYEYCFTCHDKVDDVFNITQSRKRVTLPTSKGSEWGFAVNDENQLFLETALKSTSTKEELLSLLNKTGMIKGGSWVKFLDFVTQNRIIERVKEMNDRVFTEALAELVTANPRGFKEKEEK